MHHRFIRCILIRVFAAAALLSITSLATNANAQTPADKAIPASARFFVPQPFGSANVGCRLSKGSRMWSNNKFRQKRT